MFLIIYVLLSTFYFFIYFHFPWYYIHLKFIILHLQCNAKYNKQQQLPVIWITAAQTHTIAHRISVTDIHIFAGSILLDLLALSCKPPPLTFTQLTITAQYWLAVISTVSWQCGLFCFKLLSLHTHWLLLLFVC